MHAAKTPTPPPSLGGLTTIGSYPPEAWRIVSRMVKEQGWHLVNICSQPSSFLAEWSTPSLRWHFGYRHHTVPGFGNLHELDYDQPVRLADPAISLVKVSGYLDAGVNCLLLCACPNWQHYHRKQVATLLRQIYPTLEVSHLVPDALAVELPVVTFKTAELFQCYGYSSRCHMGKESSRCYCALPGASAPCSQTRGMACWASRSICGCQPTRVSKSNKQIR